ncbi:MAG TPA: ABC transporter substrate-binding protein [Pseudolabrys sp.]|nr:ABC transporter substrate-binding protein [Pseudolabrys sp.]
MNGADARYWPIADIDKPLPTISCEIVGWRSLSWGRHASGVSSSQFLGPLQWRGLGVLKQIAPQVRRVGVVHVPEIAANVAFIRVADAISKTLGMSVTGLGVRDAADIERVLKDFAQEPNGGLIVTPSPLTETKRDVLIDVADKVKLPTVYSFRFYVESGGLVSYGNDQLETVREAASYVDRILRGANPADLPVQLPTKFSLVVNLKTAKGLGLTVPESFLLFADEVIE